MIRNKDSQSAYFRFRKAERIFATVVPASIHASETHVDGLKGITLARQKEDPHLPVWNVACCLLKPISVRCLKRGVNKDEKEGPTTSHFIAWYLERENKWPLQSVNPQQKWSGDVTCELHSRRHFPARMVKSAGASVGLFFTRSSTACGPQSKG